MFTWRHHCRVSGLAFVDPVCNFMYVILSVPVARVESHIYYVYVVYCVASFWNLLFG